MKIIIVAKGCEFSLEVRTNEPILEIKRKIHHFLGIPVDSQVLQVCDWEIVEGLDLDDYPLISDGTKMYLTTRPPSIPFLSNRRKIKITVKISTRKIDLEVDDQTDTVETLKEKIHIVDGTPIRKMALFLKGVEMEDEYRLLSEYGIHEFSEVVVVMKAMSRVVVVDPPVRRVCMVVQTSSNLLNAAKIPVEMNDSSRVDELRKMLVERRVLPVDEYIFVHKQRIMRDDCSLRWHGVENGDFLYVFKGTVSREGY